MPAPLERLMDASKDELYGGLKNVQTTCNTSHIGGGPGSYHLKKKAYKMPTPAPPIEESANREGVEASGCSSDCSSSSIYSDSLKSAKFLKSSKSQASAESSSSRGQATVAPKEHFGSMAHNTSDQEDSDRTSRSSPVSRTFHAKYRNTGSSLKTLHMFIGEMRGKRAVYKPVYKRDRVGRLRKLVMNRHGVCRYIVWGKLLEEEIDGGLTVLEIPKRKVVS